MKIRVVTLVAVAMGLIWAPAALAAPNWVTPVTNLTTPSASPGVLQVAANAKGDVAVAWLDPSTGHVFESDRPAGGTFSTPAEVSSAASQGLGSIGIDDSGLVYVFFGTDTSVSTSTARVGTKQVGASGWTLTTVGSANAADPALVPVGAVSPSGAAMATWIQTHTAGAEHAKVVFSRKLAGSTTWSAKADVTGACGCGVSAATPSTIALALDPSGNAAFLWTRFTAGFVNRIVMGQTFTAGSATWTAPSQISASGGELESQPVVAMDQSGTATAAWTRNNSANTIVQFATKTLAAGSWPPAPGGTTVTPGANDLSALGSSAGQPAIAIEPDGTTTVAWTRNEVLEERTRGPGGGAFALATQPPNSLTAPSSPVLAAGPAGGVVALWNGTSSGKSVIGAASRASGGGTFSALPSVPGTETLQPAAAVDDQGNVAAAWLNNVAGQFRVQATGLDVAAPAIADVSFPTTGTAGQEVAYSATTTDRWSPVTASWAFGDGSTGPLTGTHTYGAAGSFLATLTATDGVGNSASTSRAIQITGGSAPAVTGLKLSPTTFKAESKGASISKAKAKAKAKAKGKGKGKNKATGTTVSYNISAPATTTFTVQRSLPGVRKGKRCVAPPKGKGKAKGKKSAAASAKKGKAKACKRFVDVGSFDRVDPASGAVSFTSPVVFATRS